MYKSFQVVDVPLYDALFAASTAHIKPSVTNLGLK
jgi:hypothetical protein